MFGLYFRPVHLRETTMNLAYRRFQAALIAVTLVAVAASFTEFKRTVFAEEKAPSSNDDLNALQQRWEKHEHKLEQEFKKDQKLSQAAKDEPGKKAVDEQFKTPVKVFVLAGQS